MSRHIVVTGAAGALGRTVVAELAGAGHSITGIDLADAVDAVAGVSMALGGIDLAAADEVHEAIEQAANHHGRGKAPCLVILSRFSVRTL